MTLTIYILHYLFQDLQVIATYLYSIEGLNHLREAALLKLSKLVYYEYHDGSALLWRYLQYISISTFTRIHLTIGSYHVT